MPRWKSRLDGWGEKLSAQRENLLSYLIVLRIAPFPPHWVVNVVCPHVGIGVVPFWVSTWLGILGVSVIHTTIGGSLDDMTSAADFHLISWKNFFFLSAVVVGAMIPVGLRYYFKRELASVVDVEAAVGSGAQTEGLAAENGDTILAEGPPIAAKGKAAATPPLIDFSDDESDLLSEEDADEDIILEAGPALVVKPDDAGAEAVPAETQRP